MDTLQDFTANDIVFFSFFNNFYAILNKEVYHAILLIIS